MPKKPTLNFGIGFGPLEPKLSVQIRHQGLQFNKNEVSHFEDMRKLLMKLRMNDILPETAADAGYRKLFRQISNHVKAENPHVRFSGR